MRIRRVIISAILALGVAGSILAGSAAQASAAPAHAPAHSANPYMFYKD